MTSPAHEWMLEPEPEPRCDDDFFCGQCDDCLAGEHPENRPRRDTPLVPVEAEVK